MSNRLFNTPFELSLHVVLLLDVANAGITLDRIAAYDFMAIYCEDFGVADKSLNGENGFAFSELSARRNLIKTAIKNLVRKWKKHEQEFPIRICQAVQRTDAACGCEVWEL